MQKPWKHIVIHLFCEKLATSACGTESSELSVACGGTLEKRCHDRNSLHYGNTNEQNNGVGKS